jgi:hypothetical protein
MGQKRRRFWDELKANIVRWHLWPSVEPPRTGFSKPQDDSNVTADRSTLNPDGPPVVSDSRATNKFGDAAPHLAAACADGNNTDSPARNRDVHRPARRHPNPPRAAGQRSRPAMIGLPDHVRVYLYTQPVDLRKGFDGLTGIVTTALGQNVTNGSLFHPSIAEEIVSSHCGGRRVG